MIHRTIITSLLVLATVFSPLPTMADDISRSTANYSLPDVTVIRQDGKKFPLNSAIDDGRPVVLNFIFASCSAICPMLSHIFSKAQDKLTGVHLVSISIDPENDTPAKLIDYGKKFNAGTQWDFYTGTLESSIAIQKAFDAYHGDKMNHTSVIFMRSAPDKPWLRLEGFVSPDTVVHEYQNMLKQ